MASKSINQTRVYMSELNYSRLLQAIHVQVKRNGMTKAASDSLNKILKLTHPKRELAFLDWALHSDLYGQPVTVNSSEKVSREYQQNAL